MRALVLGASGMLGNAVFRIFGEADGIEVFGTARSSRIADRFPARLRDHLLYGLDANDFDSLVKLFNDIRPNIVINCIGLVKQLADANDPLVALPVNALLPHRLSRLCALAGARLIHVSTDCVFSGSRGSYTENEIPDAADLYGRSKLLGEVDYPNAITLRTSIIGHELDGAHSLIGWFLAQKDAVKGYKRAIFSGLPTVELARVMRDLVVPRPALRGLYHVASKPISKYDLLKLVAKVYGKQINITADDALVIDRSLNADQFQCVTGYSAPAWPELVRAMHAFG